MNEVDKNCTEQKNDLMTIISIRVRSVYLNDQNQHFILVETYNSNTNEMIQKVRRSLTEIDGLSSYILKEYGGYIIPIISSSRQLLKNIQTIPNQIQIYLEDLRLNEHCRIDPKFYCFLFEQAMAFPRQQTYTKVLHSASTMSKKYLNAIFTRKQLPQQKQAIHIVSMQEKLQIKFSYFAQIKQIISIIIAEGRIVEQVRGLLSQMSRTVNKGAQLQENKLLAIQKIVMVSNRYVLQAREAYSRWQICVEEVRELYSNLLKGLHQDMERYEIRNNQLKNWTRTLSQELTSMSSYFDSIVDYLSNFISNVRAEDIDCELQFTSDKSQLQQSLPQNQNLKFTSKTQEHQKEYISIVQNKFQEQYEQKH